VIFSLCLLGVRSYVSNVQLISLMELCRSLVVVYSHFCGRVCSVLASIHTSLFIHLGTRRVFMLIHSSGLGTRHCIIVIYSSVPGAQFVNYLIHLI